jgi:hypothetical protein
MLQQAENHSNQGAIKKLQDEINTMLEQEDVHWKQRSKQNWYMQGDRNTKFFHAWASHRRKVNTIRKTTDEEGRVWTEEKMIGRAFIHFYESLFKTGHTGRVEECLQGLETRVTDTMNAQLLRKFEASEVDMALSQMQPLKSPGPDGFAASFYQRSWATVRADVCQAVLSFLNDGIFDADINQTYIALIPKVKSPEFITDYRPISLCNVLYKLIAKVLANRLKTVLPSIISATQSAFIPGRLITDNILVAFEALHTMDAKLKGKEGFMALKLDMSKAYDRVEWTFLETVMRKIGFAERWIMLAMTCIKTVSYSILINGKPYGNILPSRGLRQGDPLSPYFFLLCAEGLSTIISRVEREARLTGLPITRGGTRLSHLFFADDSLLFCKAKLEEWHQVREALQIYEMASGQKLNSGKTAIFFSRNTSSVVKHEILEAAGVSATHSYERYLGLPALVGRSKVSTFADIIGKVWARLNGWKEKFLSQAGREILLKAVIQAIPTYTMSVFQLPKSLCKEINSMMGRFWWGAKENETKVAWMSWHRLGKAKVKGGMGYRDLERFNMALLAKQGWRLMQEPDSFIGRIYKEKYYSNGTFLSSSLGRRPSYAWRSIWNAKKLLQEGLVWRVGDGRSIKIWKDRWLEKPSSFLVQSPIQILDEEATVSELINVDTKMWNISVVSDVFMEDEAKSICQMVVSPLSHGDRLVWMGNKTGHYTVRSGYHLAMEGLDREEGSTSDYSRMSQLWQNVWNFRGPRALRMFLWRACNNILPTKENLFKRKIVDDPQCAICGAAIETVGHILWSCVAARDVWLENMKPIQKSTSDEIDFQHLFVQLYDRLEVEDFQRFGFVARQLWFRRNKAIFEGDFLSPVRVNQIATAQVEDYAMAELTQKMTSGVATSAGVPRVPCWQKPSTGVVKINWDAAISMSEEMMGVGIVARDTTGSVVGAFCCTRPQILDPTTAEAVGAWQAVLFAKRLGVEHAIFEGDSLEVVKSVKAGGSCWARYGMMINASLEELRSIPAWEFRHVRREGNGAAHRLAKQSLVFRDTRIWLGIPPLCIQDVIHVDNSSSV